MIIIGDIGNTVTKICFVNSKFKIIKRYNFDTKYINNSLLKKLIKTKFSKSVNKAVFCSVVPKSFELVRKFLIRFLKIKVYELKDLKLNSLIKIKVNKTQIGSDRISNALSVVNNKDNFIILDFGTATTFDVLIKNVYYGGVIAPGVQLSLNTLIKNASLIPNLDLKKVSKVVGSNTISAVQSGFFWGYNGLIMNIINLIKKETGKTYKIITTGGFSHLFKNSIDKKIIIDKDITIKGLIKACNLIN